MSDRFGLGVIVPLTADIDDEINFNPVYVITSMLYDVYSNDISDIKAYIETENNMESDLINRKNGLKNSELKKQYINMRMNFADDVITTLEDGYENQMSHEARKKFEFGLVTDETRNNDNIEKILIAAVKNKDIRKAVRNYMKNNLDLLRRAHKYVAKQPTLSELDKLTLSELEQLEPVQKSVGSMSKTEFNRYKLLKDKHLKVPIEKLNNNTLVQFIVNADIDKEQVGTYLANITGNNVIVYCKSEKLEFAPTDKSKEQTNVHVELIIDSDRLWECCCSDGLRKLKDRCEYIASCNIYKSAVFKLADIHAYLGMHYKAYQLPTFQKTAYESFIIHHSLIPDDRMRVDTYNNTVTLDFPHIFEPRILDTEYILRIFDNDIRPGEYEQTFTVDENKHTYSEFTYTDEYKEYKYKQFELSIHKTPHNKLKTYSDDEYMQELENPNIRSEAVLNTKDVQWNAKQYLKKNKGGYTSNDIWFVLCMFLIATIVIYLITRICKQCMYQKCMHKQCMHA